MNFDLTELAATVAIGILGIGGTACAYLVASNRKVGSAFSSLSNTSQYFIAVIAACCFVVGMIIEDISNKFVDDDKRWFTHRILDSDDEIKARTLFGDHFRDSIHEIPMSYLASRYGLLERHTGSDGAAIEKHILLKNSCKPDDPSFREIRLDEKTIKAVAKAFYYNAKTLSYKDPSYYNELKKIQMRIDFSRSLVAVTVLIIGVFIAGLVDLTAKSLWLWQRENVLNVFSKLPSKVTETAKLWKEKLSVKLDKIPKDRDEQQDREQPMRIVRVVGFAAMLGILLVAARFANASEETEFDKRVYGYYIYNQIDSEKPALPICQDVPMSAPLPRPASASTLTVADLNESSKTK